MKPWIDLDRISIDHFRQNKPSYVVKDIVEYFSKAYALLIGRETNDAVWSILLARGVLKWMSSRRALIAIKLMLRARIRDHQQEIKTKKLCLKEPKHMWPKGSNITSYHLGHLRGSLASTELIYRYIRRICHSTRWQVPDNDLRSTPFWIAQHSHTGKELLTDVYSSSRKSSEKKPEKLEFPDWTKMKTGDEIEFSCSACHKVGIHKLAGVKRKHEGGLADHSESGRRTFEWPIWICPGDVEEVELACFTCGNVEMYGPADVRTCLCGANPVGWDHAFGVLVDGRYCSTCHCSRNVIKYGESKRYICARCSYHDPAGSWFGTWIELFNGSG